MPITALYAAILAPLYVLLAIRVIAIRRSGRISLGDGGHPGLLRRIRAHANFAEYAPFTLILLGLAESLNAGPVKLHVIGLMLLAGRLAHAAALSRDGAHPILRVAGMALTFAAIITAALACLVTGATKIFA